MRLQAEVAEQSVLRVVVVLFFLDAWVGKMVDVDFHAGFAADFLHHHGEVLDAELFGELIEDAELAGRGGIRNGDLDTSNGVADIEEPSGLAALAVDG